MRSFWHTLGLSASLDFPSLSFQGRLFRESGQAISPCIITKLFLSSSYITAQELRSLFEKKSLKEKPPSSGKQSILSVRLEQCPLQLNNPFNEYSKFDGKVSKNETLCFEVKPQSYGIPVGIIIIVIVIVLRVYKVTQ